MKLLLFIFLLSLTARASESICDASLRGLHVEISKMSAESKKTDRRFAKMSTRGSIEWEHFLIDPITSGNVVSFGSGPDIFRVLENFPLAPRIHLVDMLFGQAAPGEVIDELEARLRMIGGVELVEAGFVGQLPEGLFYDHKRAYQHVSENFGNWQDIPRIWRLKWVNQSVGEMNTLVYLHMIDFDNFSQMKTLFAEMKDTGGLTGALVTGASLHSSETSLLILDSLKSGSTIANEVFYRLDGSHQILSFDSSDIALINLAGARQDFDRRVLRPRPNSMGAFDNFSRMHLFTKKKLF